jgi:flagellar assembly protein FliH
MSKIIKSSEAARNAFAAYERGILGVALQETEVEEAETEWVEPDPVALAEAEAEKRLQELYDEGLNRGFEAGKAEFERAAGVAAAALQKAAEAMRQAREDFLAAMEPQMLQLVKAITERILQREARTDPEVALNTVRAALRSIVERERLTVYMNPDDLDALRQKGLDPLEGIEGAEGIELAVDASIAPGGCTVSSDTVHVDARLDHQLELILDALAE